MGWRSCLSAREIISLMARWGQEEWTGITTLRLLHHLSPPFLWQSIELKARLVNFYINYRGEERSIYLQPSEPVLFLSLSLSCSRTLAIYPQNHKSHDIKILASHILRRSHILSLLFFMLNQALIHRFCALVRLGLMLVLLLVLGHVRVWFETISVHTNCTRGVVVIVQKKEDRVRSAGRVGGSKDREKYMGSSPLIIFVVDFCPSQSSLSVEKAKARQVESSARPVSHDPPRSTVWSKQFASSSPSWHECITPCNTSSIMTEMMSRHTQNPTLLGNQNNSIKKWWCRYSTARRERSSLCFDG